jgi:PAS domain S-box-containing protein
MAYAQSRMTTPAQKRFAPHATLSAHTFRAIWECSPFAVLVADDDGHYVDANAAACRMFECSREELIGKHLSEFVESADIEPTRGLWHEFREQKAQEGEFPLVSADGTRKRLRYHAVADFAPGLHVSFLEDVTQARAANIARVAAEAERDRIFLISSDLICVIDNVGRFQRVNPAWKSTLGYDSAELIGREYSCLVHPDDMAGVLKMRAAAAVEPSVSRHQCRLMHRQGSYRWVSWASTRSRGHDYAVGRDVTEERELAAKGEYERLLFETVLRQMPAAVGVVEADSGKVLLTNDKFAQVLRRPELASEDVGQLVASLVSGDASADTVSASITRASAIEARETTYLFGDGSQGVISVSSAPVSNAAQEVVAAVTMLSDVTEQKRAREALELSESRFRTLTDNLPVIIWIGAADGTIQYFNRYWFEYTGLSPVPEGSTELDRWADIMHPDDYRRVLPILEERRARGHEVDLVYRLRRADGAYRWHVARSTPVRDDEAT